MNPRRTVWLVFLTASAVAGLGRPAYAMSPNGEAGVAALVNNQFAAAEEALLKATAEEPNNPLWHLNLGWTYLSLDKPARALSAFKKAQTLIKATDFVRMGWVLWGEALAYEKLGRCTDMGKALTEWMSQTMTRRFDPKRKKTIDEQIQIAREKIRTCPKRASSVRR